MKEFLKEWWIEVTLIIVLMASIYGALLLEYYQYKPLPLHAKTASPALAPIDWHQWTICFSDYTTGNTHCARGFKCSVQNGHLLACEGASDAEGQIMPDDAPPPSHPETPPDGSL